VVGLIAVARAAEPLPPPTVMGAYLVGAVLGCGKSITTAQANAAAAQAMPRCRATQTAWQPCMAAVATAWCASH